MTVKVYIGGDNIRSVDVAFKSTVIPLDSVKAQAKGFLGRSMSYDGFVLATPQSNVISSYDAINPDAYNFLVFYAPSKIFPVPGNEWTFVQLEQLKIKFVDVEDCVQLFESVNAVPEDCNISARGANLIDALKDIDVHLLEKYKPEQHNGEYVPESAKAIRENPMLQNPICKALFASMKYTNHESFVDDFVKHLLNALGFNDGSLYVAPQMRFNLCYGDTTKQAVPDMTVIDLLSYARISVLEDKNWDSKLNSEPQLVAEGIAIKQQNSGQKRKRSGENAELDEETVFGVRVTGARFHFYALPISSAIQSALSSKIEAVTETTMFRYGSESGLNFMLKEDREQIIYMLSLLHKVALKTGETSRRRNSKLGN